VPIEMPDRVRHEGVAGKTSWIRKLSTFGPAASMSTNAVSVAQSLEADKAPAQADKLDPRLRKRVASGEIGTVQIEVQLSEKTPEIMDQLKRAGFVLVTEWKNSLTIVGKISIEKLNTLAGLKPVKVISLR